MTKNKIHTFYQNNSLPIVIPHSNYLNIITQPIFKQQNLLIPLSDLLRKTKTSHDEY